MAMGAFWTSTRPDGQTMMTDFNCLRASRIVAHVPDRNVSACSFGQATSKFPSETILTLRCSGGSGGCTTLQLDRGNSVLVTFSSLLLGRAIILKYPTASVKACSSAP